MNKVESRTTRDGAFTGRVAISTTDAIQPLVDAVAKLEETYDRMEKRILDAAQRAEDARRTKALEALVDEAVKNIHAESVRKLRQAESEAFERRLFGKRLPRDIRERIFGFEDEGGSK